MRTFAAFALVSAVGGAFRAAGAGAPQPGIAVSDPIVGRGPDAVDDAVGARPN